MKVLVTGGAGYVGSTLIKRLLEEGHKVVSIDNLTRGNYQFLKENTARPNLKLKEGDVCNQEDLDALGGDTDAVVHMAAITGLEMCKEDPSTAIATNVYGTYQILEWARKKEVKKVVIISSAAVYGDPEQTPITEDQALNPTNLYGVTKLAGEKIAKAFYGGHGLNAVILRFGNVYGVGLYTYWDTVIPKFVDQAWNGDPLTVYGDGTQSRDFVHVRDIAQAVISTLEVKKEKIAGEAFNVGTGNPVPINRIATLVSRVFHQERHKKVEVIHLQPRKGESYLPDFCLSPRKIQKKIGFRTQWGLRKGIKQLVRYRTQHSD